ncbi:hypothetical protein [Gryllotalpicola protaetiae]|uniref:DUF222 domain-containing protein n=1 Tax=Gryllotalpicola protaetiae TaxID=2419771 RepID=A0A387BHD8_9MICO|nr:hypothetical protein [Gryllotalpicola protaetiae]AYG03445.1 hypothetical protein D7I44_07770 [Gryllotalpicola protaetiae]
MTDLDDLLTRAHVRTDASRVEQLRQVADLRRALADRRALEQLVRRAIAESGEAQVGTILGASPELISIAWGS